MAESEDTKKPEDIKQDSPLTHTGSVIRKTVVRTFSNITGKKKRGETECSSSPSPNKNLSSGTPDSSATEDGFFHKFSSFRKSLTKNRRKSVPETQRSDTPGPQRTPDFIIPSKPLSVLQIDELLKSDCLKDAYSNLLSLRIEFQHEQEALGEKAPPGELPNKEKDLNLLCKSLRNRLTDIVRRSCDPGSKQLLVLVAKIIEEEEKREGDLGGMKGWREAWKDAVREEMRDAIKAVHLDSREQNDSWLAVHLGLLGKAIVEQLDKVKTELVSLYPSNFNVFETYVSSCHEVVGEHLKELLEKVTELKDYYAMLDFINIYHSEKILGSPSLQPEMKEQNTPPIPVDFLDQIKNKYCTCLQESLCGSLDKIIKLEQEEMWKNKITPKRTEDGIFLTTHIDMDICTMIGQFAENSEKIDGNLKNKILRSCLEVLKPFPKRFEEEFTKNIASLLGSDLLDRCLWAEYHTAYINSFSSLKKHIEVYSGSCPDEVKQLGREVDGLVLRLREVLLHQFIGEIKDFMDGLMTKNWLNTDADFREIINRLETYSGCSKSMRPPDAQFFANDMHYCVVKEYVSQLLKKKYSCKGRKNDLAADKIRDQWDELKKLFCEMGSTLDWLHPLGGQLSEIIEQENEKDIKKLIPPLIEHYPDISKKQLSAILYFRDSGVSTQWNQVTKSFSELKRNSVKTENAGNHEHTLFSDIKKNVMQTSVAEKSQHDDDIKSKDKEDSPMIENTPPKKLSSVKLDSKQNKPLSTSEIDELLKSGDLGDAYSNLLSLRLEFRREQEALVEEAPPGELPNKEKDLKRLYQTLRKRLTDIVRHSCYPNSKQLLVLVANIIEEEEKREGDLGGMKGWREAWKDAVREGMRDTIKGVHLDSCEQNVLWLAVHLGFLGKAIVEQLEKVKTELVSLYPPNFNVFETYVSSCHEVVGEHLKELLEKVTELKDYYAMLDFIINVYQSEKILGSPSLQPEMKEQKALTLPYDILYQIMNQYQDCLKMSLLACLDNIIKIEQEDVWKKKHTHESAEDEGFLDSHVHIDILTMIAAYVENTGKIDGNLKKEVLCQCLKELKDFPKKFVEEFSNESSSLLGSDILDCCLWAKYHVAYINSFILLREGMENYCDTCPGEVVQLGGEVDGLVRRLGETLLQQFSVEIKPFLGSLMTKIWLKTDDDFKEMINRIETYSGYCKSMRPPYAERFTNDMHYHVVKEYVSQLLKKKYSCKGRKNDLAAAKIRDQWDELRSLFCEMRSTFDWLHPLGGQLSEIIEQKKKEDIIKLLPALVENYPDIRKNSSIKDYFKSNEVIQRFTELKQNSGRMKLERVLFSNIE